MRFGFNYGVGAGSSRYRNSYLISYLMDTIYTDGAMDRFLDNVGSNGSNNDALALASNHIYLNGTTQSVPYPVLHTLGDNKFTNMTKLGDAVTVVDNSNGTWNITGTNTIQWDSIRFLISSGSIPLLTPIHTVFTIEVISGSLLIESISLGLDGQVSTVNKTLGNGIHFFDGNLHDADEFRLYIAVGQTFEVKISIVSVSEITLPTASYLTYFDSTTNTLTELSSTGDRGVTLPVSATYSVTDSHQFVFNHTSPLSAEDNSAIEADPNLAFRMFLDGEVLPSGFSNTDVGWFSGGNEGLVSAEKVYDLSDQAFLTYVSIIAYDALTRTTLDNQSNGASNLKLIQDGSGRTTGIAVANTTQWEADGRTAVTNWTITAPFTIAEIIDGDTYLFTSDGNRFKNLIADGTYTLPTGVWTLDEFGFDGVTPVTVRGGTGMIDEVIA